MEDNDKNAAMQTPRAFSTSLVIRDVKPSARAYVECLTAREGEDGMWSVKPRRAAISPNGSIVMFPPREKAVIVDGNIAYEMLKSFEAANEIPEDRRGRVLEGTRYFPEMEEIARQARLETAKKAGGKPKRVHLARRIGPKNL